jgi:hypothetical protein
MHPPIISGETAEKILSTVSEIKVGVAHKQNYFPL